MNRERIPVKEYEELADKFLPHGQLKELFTNYGRIDIMWYDGGRPFNAEFWESKKMNSMIRKLQPVFGILILVLSFFGEYSYSTISPVGVVASISNVSGFVINGVHNKLYVTTYDTTLWWTDNLLVLDLYDSGTIVSGTPIQNIKVADTVPTTDMAMALDVMNKKLYVGVSEGDIYIYNISDSGMILTPPTYYSHKSGTARTTGMYIDFVHNLLVTTGPKFTSGLLTGVTISRLGSDGMPTQAKGDTYPTITMPGGTDQYYIATDPSLGVIYAGIVGTGSWIKTDNNGYPVPAFSQVVSPGGAPCNMVLDSANQRLYFIGGAYTWEFIMWRLNTDGTYDTWVDLNPYFYGQATDDAFNLAIDSARRRMFVAGGYWDSANIYFITLDGDGKPATTFDTGNYGGNATSTSMAYEPFYNKIYLWKSWSGGNGFMTYNGPDSPLVPIIVNNGETITEIPNVTLKFQSANPNFIYVSGDLLSIGNPVNDLNKWVSCGGGFWKNAGDTMRAGTLTVSAVLSSGAGEKTIEVWYCGSVNGYQNNSNFTGMMRKGTVKINLIESSATVTSIGLTRIDYSGVRIDYVIKDGRDRNVNVAVQYRTADKDWANANAGQNNEGTTNLSAKLAGVAHYFIWDVEKDLPENAKEVQIRIKADNPDSEGMWTETAKYGVPDWTGSDIRVVNVSIRKPDNSWLYRARVEWSGLTDTTTSYEIRKKSDNGVGNAEGAWEWVTATSGTITEVENLSDSPVYSFRVRSRTKEGLFSAYSKTAGIKLGQRLYGTNVIGKTGGKVEIEDFDENAENNARVEIEDGTFREDVTVLMEKFSEGEYEITGKKTGGMDLMESDFKKGATLKLAYKREEIQKKGWNEDGLAIFHFDGVNWNSIGGKIDKTNCLVTVKVKHFSIYRISKNVAKPVMSITPDFFTPNTDGINDVLRFYFSNQDSVEKAQIRIYDINGRIIKTISADGTNTLYWDGRDDSGNLVEAGIYICAVESGTAKLTRTVQLVK